ncbi:hypothetical protein COV82_04040 [Candidatus Peregrinibacteria bacterium CG11_big_fil_rev_8_21_14_0_20_46_8]|nr:MAG: hypothetical protein COV82_04040 [Candidatus Peregrinibacteria bacterium CG11_big_fil_rev_8_21_14_0_20_46_8]
MTLSGILQVIAACTFLAAFPALVWGYIFYRKQPEDRRHTLLTFAIGGLAVFPILFYKWSWKYFPSINILEYARNFENDLIGISGFILIPLSVIITFAFVGVIEEIMKQSVVHAVDDNRIRHIDDSIMFSILAALGFSFTENILYFYTIWMGQGAEHLLIPFLFRSVFSTFAHILFSATFGYYYGLAHFASPLLQKELTNSKWSFWDWYNKVVKFRTVELFHEKMMFTGLFYAVVLHAAYNIFLEMNWTFLMVPYLVVGYLYVSHLMKKKENHQQLDLLLQGERNNKCAPGKIACTLRKLVPKSAEA